MPDKARTFEQTDLSVRGLWIFFAALAVFLALTFLVLHFFERDLDRWLPGAHATRTVEPPRRSARGPQLQENPARDLQALRRQEDAALHETAWLDHNNGVLRIPIERAMALVAERGLPARAARRPATTPEPRNSTP